MNKYHYMIYDMNTKQIDERVNWLKEIEVYMNDILVHSGTEEEHVGYLMRC